jgi:outer membrane protein assembly factor BamD
MKCFRVVSETVSCIPRLAVVAAVVFALSGCAGTNLMEFYFGDLFGKGTSAIDKTAEQLAVDGMQQMQKKNYDEAVKDFKKLKEHYPYSKYAILAELKLGDAYFFNTQYGEASIAYEEFVRLHPRNEVIPYVLYQVGMSHFLAFSTVDRDPEETQLAYQSFQKVIQNFPKSEYAKKSEKQINECRKRLVSHDINVARYYYTVEEYHAARSRLRNAIQKYPQAIADMGYGKEVQKMMTKCEAECAKGEKKPSFWTRVGF